MLHVKKGVATTRRQYGVWLAAGKFDMLRFKRVRLLVWGVGLITACVLLALLLSFTATRVAESKGGPTSRSRDALTVADEEGRISYRPRDHESLESQLEQELVHNNAEIFKRAIQRPAHNSTAQKNDDTRKQQKAQAEIYQCLAQKGVTPWLQAMGDSSETYIVFYGKPIMHILWSIVSSRGWKLKHIPKDSSDGLKQLQELISPEHFLIVLTTSLINRGVIRDLANSTNALVGTVGNAFSVTGSKRAQLTSFTNYFQSFGCSLEDTDIMPRSFILDNPTECIQFFRYSNMHPQSWWILKPSGGQGGDGITIHSNLTYFYWHYATCMTQPDAIVQEYITSPLLVKNRKFDIRAYILLARTAPYYLAFYHEGYLRVSMKEFDIHGSRDVHLTNSHVQVSVEGFSKSDHFWSFQDLQDYLDEHRPKDGRDFVLTTLAPFIQKTGVFIVHAG